MTFHKNLLDQALDISGSLTSESGRDLGDEAAALGRPVAGQTGASASITSFAAGISTLTGLTGMTAESRGRYLEVSGASTPGNNGTFLIVEYVSATSVKVANSAGVAPDANNGSISWQERQSYSLEDDLNFIRTDRANIKGVAYTADIPTYERPTAVGTNVPANLQNIASKTTDAKGLVINRKFEDQAVAATNTFVTLSDAGNLPHADAVDKTGIPIHDGADVNNHLATYVEIIDPATESALEVLGGGNQGQRIFGRTRAGSATEPDEVEVEFRSVVKGADLSTSAAYTWEAGQPTSVDMFIGDRQRLDNLSETALRTVLSSGVSSNADLSQDIKDIRQTIDVSFSDGATSLVGLLTNTGNYYIFSDLPDGTPSIVEALNTINAQIGNRTYSAPGNALLTVNGEDITASLQKLANAIEASSVVRAIERLSADVNAGTSHLIPGSASYTLDGTDNGINMYVYWRGLLRDPGPVSGGNDYEETDTTHITPYTKIKAGDHINYFILQ